MSYYIAVGVGAGCFVFLFFAFKLFEKLWEHEDENED